MGYDYKKGNISMGKFDLKAIYDKSQTYELKNLIHEIMDEYGDLYQTCNGKEKNEQYKNIKNKFSNKDKSGIIDKLEKHFDFDIEKMLSKNNEVAFETLKLLKYLYKLDKHKRTKKVNQKEKSWEEQQDIDIVFLDLLRKPHLENFKTILPANSVYEKVFGNVRRDINEMIPNYIELDNRITRINEIWQYYLVRTLFYIIEDLTWNYPQAATGELKHVNLSLKENLCSNIKHICLPILWFPLLSNPVLFLFILHRVQGINRTYG